MDLIKKYKTCPYCGDLIYGNSKTYANHLRWCEYNPDYEKILNRSRDKQKKSLQKTIDSKLGEIKEFEVTCNCCGKKFIIKEREYKFNPNKKYYCTRSCANTRVLSDETKKRISESLFSSEKNIKRREEKEVHKKTHQYFCGSKELDETYPEISNHQSKKWFNKFIPFGLDITKLYTPNIIEEFDKVKSLLYKEYVINGLSPQDIYEKYDCSKYFKCFETLSPIFKEWGFPTRNLSEAVVNAWLKGNLKEHSSPNQYKQQWHTTWDGKEVFLRSSYELDYAKELDSQKIEYEVEFFHIKYFNSQLKEYRCAIPDFYIPSTNTIVEIKSNYTLDIQNMKDKFKAYKDLGYKCKLICDKKEINII